MITLAWIIIGIVAVGFLAAALAPLLLEDDTCPNCRGHGSIASGLGRKTCPLCRGKGVN